MAKAKQICFDRLLPKNLNRHQLVRAMPGGAQRAISLIGKQWVNGSKLRIRFLDGDQSQRDMVQEFAPEWTKYANLDFEFTDDPRSEIRVSFDPNDGAWSYLGTDNTNIPLHAATLNLGWVDKGVIQHEFGHMIGLSHEHQNPDGGIVWNEAAVIADLSGPPNFWDEPTIRHNVLNKYRVNQIHGTDFDKLSVMLYAFPDSWTTNMGATTANDDLSDLDRQFVTSAEMYPGRANPVDPDERATELAVATSTEAEISSAGEEDLYKFEVRREGVHVVETTGSTDVVMTLFGPGSVTKLVAEDDDSGSGRNSQISADLQVGTYYARVRHYNPRRQGAYRIRVSSV